MHFNSNYEYEYKIGLVGTDESLRWISIYHDYQLHTICLSGRYKCWLGHKLSNLFNLGFKPCMLEISAFYVSFLCLVCKGEGLLK